MLSGNTMPIGLFIALFGYLLGSVPTGLLLTKLFSKMDPRHAGSQNIGATNIYRTAGKKLGILTLVGDVLKGVIPIGIAMRFVGEQWGLPSEEGKVLPPLWAFIFLFRLSRCSLKFSSL
jgi:acyl-phosphate glycerol 3-phosphate acyltransferase